MWRSKSDGSRNWTSEQGTSSERSVAFFNERVFPERKPQPLPAHLRIPGRVFNQKPFPTPSLHLGTSTDGLKEAMSRFHPTLEKKLPPLHIRPQRKPGVADMPSISAASVSTVQSLGDFVSETKRTFNPSGVPRPSMLEQAEMRRSSQRVMIEKVLRQRSQRQKQTRRMTRIGQLGSMEEEPLNTDLINLPPLQAMRTAFLQIYGSLNAIWRTLDNNGSGSLSFTEFKEGIEKSGVDYKTVAGVTDIKELFMLFDVDGSNDIDLVEFIGYPEVEEPPKNLGKEPAANLWKRYINAKMASPMAMSRDAKWSGMPPLQYDLTIEHPPVELQAIVEESKRDIEDIRQSKKAELARIEEHCRRVGARLGHLADSRNNMKSLGETVLEAIEGTKEERDKRAAEEKAEQAKQKFQGMTKKRLSKQLEELGCEELETGIEAAYKEALRGSATLNSSQCGAKPRTDEELINYFGEHCIDPDEKKLRQIAKDHGIPYNVVGKIQSAFYKYDRDRNGNIDKDEFRQIMRDAICTGKAKDVEIPECIVEKEYIQADRRRRGEIHLEDFLIWSWQTGRY